ncbi:glycosyltransferase [Shinella zoogloeoides]|uniref:glycosyltransferase n=1 Tax=Shinella zoogloeoides TaxID=352475 RepID=UPI00273DED1B|nr:glycosyltransferase [Shinella zoogloeoides]WLR92957.1 glycosyltransferase [Shinella zoogloeoides]
MRNIKNFFWRIRREKYAVLFDETFYLEKNHDVRDSGHDPLKHYLTFGWQEGRDPSSHFSTSEYLKRHPHLVNERIDPLTHFIRSGKKSNSVKNGTDETYVPQHTYNEEEYTPYFDAEYYKKNYQDIANSDLDPFFHYMNHGWKEHRNPSNLFNTAHYLAMYVDIAHSGMNPLQHFVEHGRGEGRSPLPFRQKVKSKTVSLKVTAIVPNYNHAPFLEERLNSILNQTYQNLEIIILDDCSTDDSRAVIEKFRSTHPELITTILNERNSGSIFSQWRRGIEAANGNLVWICESDDFCEPTFLEEVIQGFADESVMVSFGRIQFADRSGAVQQGLDGYREQSMPGAWAESFSIPAAKLFQTAFGNTNIIPNVGGCVFRHQVITPSEWKEAMSYKILGDWYLYLILSRGGKIHYAPSAVSYFRQHGGNTSVKSFVSEHYYVEHARIGRTIREYWGSDDLNTLRLYKRCEEQFDRFSDQIDGFSLPGAFNVSEVLSTKRTKTHILMGVLGFELGGGELFPVYLANELVSRGFLVSFLAIRVDHHASKVREELDSRVSVYDIQDALEFGVDAFLESASIDIVHSHYLGIEYYLLQRARQRHPYVVTLHGSYDSASISDRDLMTMIRGVDCWVYLTQKNLKHLDGIPLSSDVLRHIPNGVPEARAKRGVSRADLDISDDAIVFVIASRAIEEKGWRETIAALEAAQQATSAPLCLILCGTGPVYDDLVQQGVPSNVRLLGYRNDIRDIYEISDVVVLATRFVGESFPLGLIQAMQAGKPIVATAIGEIGAMITSDDNRAGILLPNLEDDATFISQLEGAIISLLDVDLRNKCSLISRNIGERYDIRQVASAYEQLYADVISRRAMSADETMPT